MESSTVMAALDELAEYVAERVVEVLADRLPAVQPSARSSPWLTPDEAAEYIRASRKRMYDLASQNRVPAHRDGSRLLFRREELDQYLLTEEERGLGQRRAPRAA